MHEEPGARREIGKAGNTGKDDDLIEKILEANWKCRSGAAGGSIFCC